MKYLGCLILTRSINSVPAISISKDLVYPSGFKFYSIFNTEEENEEVKKFQPHTICVCGKKHLINNFYIKKENGEIQILGSQCIKKILNEDKIKKKQCEQHFHCKDCSKKAMPSPFNGGMCLKDLNKIKKAEIFSKTRKCLNCYNKLMSKTYTITNNPTFYDLKLVDILNDRDKKNKLFNLIKYVNDKGYGDSSKWLALKADLIEIEKIKDSI